MAARFVNVDRNTPMLLPPDLRDWVEEDDLVHFIIEAVDRLPLEIFQVNHRGSGTDQFPWLMICDGRQLTDYFEKVNSKVGDERKEGDL